MPKSLAIYGIQAVTGEATTAQSPEGSQRDDW